MKQLNNAIMEVSFPFANRNSMDELYIYRRTVEQLLNIENEAILVHLGEYPSIYNVEVDYLLCKTDKNLKYPSVKIISESKELEGTDNSLYIKVLHPKISLICENKSTFELTNDKKFLPPCHLKALKIRVVGDLICDNIV